MYKKVLIPLDGSKVAETALDHMRTLAGARLIGELTILKVVDMPTPVAMPISVEEGYDFSGYEDLYFKEAQKYLYGMEDQLKSEGINVKAETIIGRTVSTILEYQKENDIDLIILATHGHSGVTKFLLGSVANKIVQSSQCPVFLIRA
ncbi:MAG: universal stress protein [Deltaproteobacteria bacterium]|nr:universal stress protein [Deltaproteobacteria bacterium]